MRRPLWHFLQTVHIFSPTMTRRAIIFTLSGTAAGVAIAYGFRQFGST
ncbi:MAG: hypothetical protein AAB305_00300 [Candidatus Zixiibacteriota bacterium]